MSFFPEEGGCPGAISWAADFKPSKEGVLVSLVCDDMEQAIEVVKRKGGKIVTPKTKIEADNRGYFALFIDSEGNWVGLYSDR